MSSATKIDTVLFDLDGTLLDTLDDLSASANYALATCGYPTASKELCRLTVGNGALRLLCDLAHIPADADSPEASKLLATFMEHYGAHCEDKTAPFPGTIELLQALRGQGIKIGVVSNKPDNATKKLCAHFFGSLVDFTLGATPQLARKPSPEPIHAALEALSSDASRAAYVGDSEPDVLVAQNAQMALGIAVNWGFRTIQQLEAAGAKAIATTPEEILSIIQHANAQ